MQKIQKIKATWKIQKIVEAWKAYKIQKAAAILKEKQL